MSYSIYYDRAFIRAGERFIPLVNSGSNNCYEYRNGREIPEKNWGLLNWKHLGQILFTPDEIRLIASEYDRYNQESGMLFKSRHRLFEPGEFDRWVINGMKNAYTVEEYRSFGNGLYVLDYSPSESRDWNKHSVSSTDELLGILDRLDAVREIDVKLADNREVYRPVNHRSRGRGLWASDLEEYYVLGGEGVNNSLKGLTVYLVKLLPSSIRYLTYKTSNALKVFRTERDAEKYLSEYGSRLKLFAAFKPELISKAGAL